MTKNELRRQIRLRLKEEKDSLRSQSEKICRKILETEEYNKSQIILAYMALLDEVDLSAVIQQAVLEEKKVYVPRVVPDSTQMDFFRYQASKQLSHGSFGIEEPDGNGEKFEIGGQKGKILVLVPGRAFTVDGKRLGRGKGYYDSYLTRLSDSYGDAAVFAGICFPLQLVDDLPLEAHDVKMKMVIN